MKNLKAEMTRYGVTVSDLQAVLGITEKAVRNKLNGVTEFTVSEIFKIRDAFFPSMRIEYLFHVESAA